MNFEGGLYDILHRLNLVHENNVIHVQTGVRGNPNTSVYKDSETRVIWLNNIVEDNHYSEMDNYWQTTSIEDARSKCFADDVRRFNMLKTKFNPTDKILDVGTGCGGLLKLSNTYFDVVNGVEVQENTRITLLRDNLEVFSTVKHGKTYDVVTLFHVFEHVV